MMQEKTRSSVLDAAELALETERIRAKLIREGVSEGRAGVIINIFIQKVKKGVPPGYVERHIQTEVLQAKRESEIDQLASSLAARFHLSVERVSILIARDVRRLRENPRLLVQLVIQKYEDKLRQLSRTAYDERRANQSSMAAAMVKAGTTRV